MALGAEPAWICPTPTETALRTSMRRDSTAGHVHGDRGEGEGEVLGEVGAGGVPAAAGELDPEGVGGRGDRPDAGAHLAHVDRGSQWRARMRDVGQDALGDHVEGPPGIVSSPAGR
jgi:hypothetical protein